MKNFSQHLRVAIQAKFGRPLKVIEFAKACQLRLTHEVSYEAVRKWMTGKSIPKIDILSELIAWLELEPNKLFDYQVDDLIPQAKAARSLARKPEDLDDELIEHLLERAHSVKLKNL